MKQHTQEINSESVEKTFETGKKIGHALKGGTVVCLTGTLGSGKTTLIKGIASGAGASNSQHVTSPTFVIVNEYYGKYRIYHIDAYRITNIEEFRLIGFEDFIGPESIVLIEWADRVEKAIEGLDKISIEMSHSGPESRKIKITGLNVEI